MNDPLIRLLGQRDAEAASPLTRLSERHLMLGVGGVILFAALLLLYIMRDAVVAAGFAAMGLGSGALLIFARKLFPATQTLRTDFDWSLVRDAADVSGEGVAITDRAGRMVCANALYESWFGGPVAPAALPLSQDVSNAITMAGKSAWRDGRSQLRAVEHNGRSFALGVVRSGRTESHLIWRFGLSEHFDAIGEIKRVLDGIAGQRLGAAGLMAALIDAEGRLMSATPELIMRATGRVDSPVEGREFVTFLETDAQNAVRFSREGSNGQPLRLMQLPVEPDAATTATVILMFDDEGATAVPIGSASITSGMQSLMAKLPLGLALADRDGRFLFLNDAFCRAVGIDPGSRPVYPGDLVVREDKAAVADTVRKHAMGPQNASDIAVRLVFQPEEPVALTIAGARGLGDAGVLLSIKDSTEESRLKKQVAQQTKMQAVGQLAGGVAHDFNNILTAIIGHCDLMLMRHTPGDSDYDDIQQIKNNSNRAASLTRQLLAFSRQQTLRPQVLQLPDVVSEISSLLKRLMGEMVELEVTHGRNLGAVRADPGQLEQVIVNLAVNARDAMPRGGKLTIRTYPLGEEEARKLGGDILPPGDYTALSVGDTGIGISAELLPKIFEPFFTTKEVGKGTGLGLSTVYGIVKQSGGFIFADSTVGVGTQFVIYLPVHIMQANEAVAAAAPKEKSSELWGSGTILLVEDEDMVRTVAERALTRQGYSVRAASNGEEALEMLEAEPDVDLIISDVVMPILDGPTMAAQARKSHPHVPVLFMSGYAEEQLRKSISIENVNFLPKPFSVQQLAEAVRGALPAPEND